jgi:hypothetical protein
MNAFKKGAHVEWRTQAEGNYSYETDNSSFCLLLGEGSADAAQSLMNGAPGCRLTVERTNT